MMLPIIRELDVEFIYNLSLLHFILISTYQDSEDEDKFHSIQVAIDIGKKMMRKYLYSLKCKDNDYKECSYSVWYEAKISSNNLLVNRIENDEVIAGLGYCIIQILESCNMVINKLITKSKEEKYYILTVDKNLANIHSKSILNLPLKLPMIVKPKPFDNNILGGYLLNDINYKE